MKTVSCVFLLFGLCFDLTHARYIVDPNLVRGRGIASDVFIVSNKANIRIHHNGDSVKFRPRDGKRASFSIGKKREAVGSQTFSYSEKSPGQSSTQIVIDEPAERLKTRVEQGDIIISRKDQPLGELQGSGNVQAVRNDQSSQGPINGIVIETLPDSSTNSTPLTSNDRSKNENRTTATQADQAGGVPIYQHNEIDIPPTDSRQPNTKTQNSALNPQNNAQTIELREQTVGGNDGRVEFIGQGQAQNEFVPNQGSPFQDQGFQNSQTQSGVINEQPGFGITPVSPVQNGNSPGQNGGGMMVTPPSAGKQNFVDESVSGNDEGAGGGQGSGPESGPRQINPETANEQFGPMDGGGQQGTGQTTAEAPKRKEQVVPTTFPTRITTERQEREDQPTTPPTQLTLEIPEQENEGSQNFTALLPDVPEQDGESEEQERTTEIPRQQGKTGSPNEPVENPNFKTQREIGRHENDVERPDFKSQTKTNRRNTVDSTVQRKQVRDGTSHARRSSSKNRDWWDSDSWGFDSWESDSVETKANRRSKLNREQDLRSRKSDELKERKTRWREDNDSSDWDNGLLFDRNKLAQKNVEQKRYPSVETRIPNTEQRQRQTSVTDNDSEWFNDSSESSDRYYTENEVKQTGRKSPDNKGCVSCSSVEYDYSDESSDKRLNRKYIRINSVSDGRYDDRGFIYDDSDYWEDSDTSEEIFNRPLTRRQSTIYRTAEDSDESWESGSFESFEKKLKPKVGSQIRGKLSEIEKDRSKMIDSEVLHDKRWISNSLHESDSWESDSSWEDDYWDSESTEYRQSRRREGGINNVINRKLGVQKHKDDSWEDFSDSYDTDSFERTIFSDMDYLYDPNISRPENKNNDFHYEVRGHVRLRKARLGSPNYSKESSGQNRFVRLNARVRDHRIG